MLVINYFAGGNLPKGRTLITALCAVLLMLSSIFYAQLSFCLSQAEAESAIQTAESELLACYEAVYEAERAGANVSSLLKVLNEAGWFFSKAKLAYHDQNFNSAYYYALNGIQKLEGVIGRADSLKLEAEQASRMDFLINYVGSAIGSVAVLVGGYVVWFFLKKSEKP